MDTTTHIPPNRPNDIPTEWDEQVVSYKDNEIEAEIHVGTDRMGFVYRLIWGDYVANEWHEDFPTLDIARKRLADLIESTTREGRAFEFDYDDFLKTEVGYKSAWRWRVRPYMAAMRDVNYEAEVIELGGGLLCVETQYNGVTAWAETNEGYARVGFYPTHLMANSHEGAIIEWPQDQVLTKKHAVAVSGLLDVIEEVAKERKNPHTHLWKPLGGMGADTAPVYCDICGVRKAEF